MSSEVCHKRSDIAPLYAVQLSQARERFARFKIPVEPLAPKRMPLSETSVRPGNFLLKPALEKSEPDLAIQHYDYADRRRAQAFALARMSPADALRAPESRLWLWCSMSIVTILTLSVVLLQPFQP